MSMSIYLQQALKELWYIVVKKKWQLQVRFSPSKKEPRASNKDFDQDWKRDKDDLSLAVLESRLEQKTPVTKF